MFLFLLHSIFRFALEGKEIYLTFFSLSPPPSPPIRDLVRHGFNRVWVLLSSYLVNDSNVWLVGNTVAGTIAL